MLSWWMVVAVGAVCIAAVAFLLWRRRQGDDTVRHIGRLATEIVEVAGTVDADLEAVCEEAPFVVLRQRCRECRERAGEALTEGKALRQRDSEALVTTLLLLHEDHRRIVDLRSEVDRALARRSACNDRCVVVPCGRAKPSMWPTSSLLTRPSTLG
jgi:hypothetical protein